MFPECSGDVLGIEEALVGLWHRWGDWLVGRGVGIAKVYV